MATANRKTPAMVTNADPLLSVAEIATYSGFNEATIRRRIQDGILPATRFGARALRVRMSAVDKWLNTGDPV